MGLAPVSALRRLSGPYASDARFLPAGLPGNPGGGGPPGNCPAGGLGHLRPGPGDHRRTAPPLAGAGPGPALALGAGELRLRGDLATGSALRGPQPVAPRRRPGAVLG